MLWSCLSAHQFTIRCLTYVLHHCILKSLRQSPPSKASSTASSGTRTTASGAAADGGSGVWGHKRRVILKSRHSLIHNTINTSSTVGRRDAVSGRHRWSRWGHSRSSRRRHRVGSRKWSVCTCQTQSLPRTLLHRNKPYLEHARVTEGLPGSAGELPVITLRLKIMPTRSNVISGLHNARTATRQIPGLLRQLPVVSSVLGTTTTQGSKLFTQDLQNNSITQWQ